MINILPSALYKLAESVNKPVYVVGGAVRNYLLNVSNDKTDIDICGCFDAELFCEIKGVRISSVNKKMGTCQIRFMGAVFEYTRFRSEEYEGGAHEPKSVTFHEQLALDAIRRDFTCNSIYYDVQNDRMIDLLGGIKDIESKQLRMCSEDTFMSDGLRILRAVRFAAQLGFSIEENTLRSIGNQAHLLLDISPDRKRDELELILHADEKYGIKDAHYFGLKLMQSCDIFRYVIPEVKALEGVKQNPKYHVYDVLEHTLLAVRYARSDVRLAALMHDLGKPDSLDDEGHMKGHHILSEKLAKIALGRGRLNYSNKIIAETASLCYLHMYDLKGETSDSKMRVFVAENFELIDKLAALRDADGRATGMNTNSKFNRFLYFKQQLIDENAPLKSSELNVRGQLLDEFGIEKAHRADLLKELWHQCIINPALNNEHWLTEQIKKSSNKG